MTFESVSTKIQNIITDLQIISKKYDDDKILFHKYFSLDGLNVVFNMGYNFTVNDEFKVIFNDPTRNLYVMRLLIQIQDSSTDPLGFGGQAALAEGFSLFYKIDSGDSENYLAATGDLPIKTNGSFDRICFDNFIHVGQGANDDLNTWRFSLNKSIPGGILIHDTGEVTLKILETVDLSAIENFNILLQGYTLPI
jgi:hypothetical protein